MELEFDKEIDAILRKARPSRGVLVGDDPPEPKDPREQKKHVDVDVIAAFVDNALPEKARMFYVEHFADCDQCRKALSFAMLMNAEADASEKNAAPVATTATETIIPWYQSIFRAPNIAFTMGALVLAFSGVLGYLVLQNQKGESNETVSQITEPEQERGGPYINSESSAAIPTPTDAPVMEDNMNASAANVSANTTTTAKSAPEMMSAPAANAAASVRSGQYQLDGASSSENSFVLDGQEVGGAQTAKKPAAGAPITTDLNAGVVGERDEKKADAEVLKENDKDTTLAKRKLETRSLMRDAPPPAKSSPVRPAGPLQNQSNQSNAGQMSVTRTVGGKTFNNRDGAWYDSAYKNQTTSNYRRGTSEYKKLDSELRNIADTLGGTVVVVWKAKAYRIQ